MIENLRSMAVFAIVVEEGSFRAAGEKLGLSSSVISHHVSSLEKRLGLRLLIRSSRKISLTDHGAKLFQSAAKMVGFAYQGLDAIKFDESEPSGILRISAPSFLSGGVFTSIVEDFLLAHPKIGLDLDFRRKQPHPMNDPYDLVIGVDKIENPGVSIRRLIGGGAGFYAAPDLAERIARTKLADIPSKIPLLLSSGFAASEWAEFLAEAGQSIEQGFIFRLKCDDLSTLHQICRSGAGLAVLPHSRAKADLESGRLIEVLQGFPIKQVDLIGMWTQGSEPEAQVVLFLNHLGTELKHLQKS